MAGLAFVAVGTALTTVHTAAADVHTFGGLYLGNVAADGATGTPRADIAIVRGGTTVYVVKNVYVPWGEAPVIVAPRLALQAGDVLRVIANKADAIVATYSYYEEVTV